MQIFDDSVVGIAPRHSPCDPELADKLEVVLFDFIWVLGNLQFAEGANHKPAKPTEPSIDQILFVCQRVGETIL